MTSFSAVSSFPELFTPRPRDSHKGTFGTLGIIGGTTGMSGAVVLAATAAIYTGCGKVWAGFNQSSLPMPIIPNRPEIMLACASQLLLRDDINTWVAGCGLGLSDSAAETLKCVMARAHNTPLLLDADALTLLAQHKDLSRLAKAHPHLILTPHPTEASRLLHSDTASVQADREAAVRQIALTYHATVVLKGQHSLVCSHTQSDRIYTNKSGNPGLSTAGSGDVLSGIIGALLAQGICTWQAVAGGVWLHGAAADYLAKNQGEKGMLAGELPQAARYVRNKLPS